MWAWVRARLPLFSSQQRRQCELVLDEGPARGVTPDDDVIRALQLQLAATEEECSKNLRELSGLNHEHAEVKGSLMKGQKNEAALSRALAAAQQHSHETERRLIKLQNELERAVVLLKKEQQDKMDVMRDLERYRDQVNRRLLTQGTDIQAAFPTPFEIRARIERAAIEAAGDWLEVKEASTNEPHHGVSYRRVLAGLFLQCQALVQQYDQQFTDFSLGGSAAVLAGVGTPVRQETADFMREHMRRHFATLFPLTGTELDHACRKVDAMLRRWIARTLGAPASRPQGADYPSPEMAKVIEEYLNVLVTAKLQNPPMEFSDDCGMEQPFNPKVHSQPIDGDSIGNGDTCIVVFPSMMQEADDGSGLTTLTKKFILPATDLS